MASHSTPPPEETVQDFDNDAPPPPPPTDLREWASPEQLLEMARLVDQLKLKHRAEADELRNELRRVVIERDGLAKELRRHERAADGVHAMRVDAERSRAQSAGWVEERSQLVLKLQSLTNEVMRLRSHVGGAPGSSAAPSESTADGHRHVHRGESLHRPAASMHGGGTPTPSASTQPTTSASFLSVGAVEELRAELLAALEAQHRQSCHLIEGERRLEFLQALHGMQMRMCEHRCATAQQEITRVSSRFAAAEDDVVTARDERAAAERQFAKLERAAHESALELERLRRETTAARVSKEDSTSAQIASLRDALAEERDRAHDALEGMQQTFARHQAEQVAAMKSLTARHDAQVAHLCEANEQLQKELSEQRREASLAATRLHDEAAQAHQEAAVQASELERLQLAYRELCEAHNTACARVDEYSGALGACRVDLERAHSEYGRLRARYDEAVAAQNANGGPAEGAAAVAALQSRLAAADAELRDLRTAHAQYVRESQAATDLVLRQADEERRASRERAERAEKECASLAVRSKRAVAERDLAREKMDAVMLLPPPAEVEAAAAAKRAEAAASPPPQKPVDVLELLQANARAASQLRRSVNGGMSAPDTWQRSVVGVGGRNPKPRSV